MQRSRFRYAIATFQAFVIGIIVIACGKTADRPPTPTINNATSTAIAITTPTSIPSNPPSSNPATPTASTSGKTAWKPALRSSWQWQLGGSKLDSSIKVQVYDIDGFEQSAATIAALHAQGAKVICYIDAGSWEKGRPDANNFPSSIKGKVMDGWPDEQWLDIRQISILGPLITARMDMCKSKGFDAIEPDNIDGYTNDTGFSLTAQDQIAYNTYLANAAHQRGLSIGLKNDLDQVQALLSKFDWALNEQCFEYQECDKLVPFVQAGKAVFNVEYNLDTSQFCPQANSMNFNSMKKNLQLDSYRAACR
jgi:hypothetical protein